MAIIGELEKVSVISFSESEILLQSKPDDGICEVIGLDVNEVESLVLLLRHAKSHCLKDSVVVETPEKNSGWSEAKSGVALVINHMADTLEEMATSLPPESVRASRDAIRAVRLLAGYAEAAIDPEKFAEFVESQKTLHSARKTVCDATTPTDE